MDKNRIRGLPGRTSEPMIAKSGAIKGRDGEFGGCAVKAVELTSGGLRRFRKSRTERLRKGRDCGAEVSRRHSNRSAGEGLNDGQGYQDGTLMRTKRKNIQLELALEPEAKGEARSAGGRGTEACVARAEPEHPVAEQGVSMEAVVEPGILKKARARVRGNKGAPGFDGMTVDDLGDHLKAHWPEIKFRLLDGMYTPQPVRRVETPKASGGTCWLGVPTVLDRFIQQVAMQVLQGDWDPSFSDASYGFRLGRSAHQAVKCAQEHISEGFGIVVDLDLEEFFDRVNHDIEMGLVAKRVADKRLLRLIRGFLTAGVLEGGLVGPSTKGVPQDGPLSPILSNLMLDVLDKELEKRGHRFVRYADDCNIYVRSQRARERVMPSVSDFLARRLKLTVNADKSAVDHPAARAFLDFSLTAGRTPRRRIAPQAPVRFKTRVRELTRCTKGVSLTRLSTELSRYLIGWRGYFGFCARPLRCCAASTNGSDGGSAPSSGGNGSADAPVSRRYAALVSTSTWPRKPPAAPVAHGGSATAPRSPTRCPTPSSPGLVSPLWRTMPWLKSIEPPSTDPYARWCGRDGAARLPPIPISPHCDVLDVADCAMRRNALFFRITLPRAGACRLSPLRPAFSAPRRGAVLRR